jgi:hypothetical protein
MRVVITRRWGRTYRTTSGYETSAAIARAPGHALQQTPSKTFRNPPNIKSVTGTTDGRRNNNNNRPSVQAHARARILHAPIPASAIASQSSARPSSRRKKRALARCSASTASISFFLSASRARSVALGGAWEPGTWEARVDAMDGRMDIGRRSAVWAVGTGGLEEGLEPGGTVRREAVAPVHTGARAAAVAVTGSLAEPRESQTHSHLWTQSKCIQSYLIPRLVSLVVYDTSRPFISLRHLLYNDCLRQGLRCEVANIFPLVPGSQLRSPSVLHSFFRRLRSPIIQVLCGCPTWTAN